ncbi:MAG: hypothetical protein IPP51_10145 [Bacteroidetes bacterium]|nr:hypothetical protein [Bacteroidota bacterium]
MKNNTTLTFLFILIAGISFGQSGVKLTSGMLGTMEARHIGPALWVDVLPPSMPLTKIRILYVGTAGGGI